MQIRFRRSQRMTGIMSKSTIFTLEARVDISDEELGHLKKYKLGQEIIYARERVSSDKSGESSWTGVARNLAAYATALTIRIDDLIKGTKVECKDILEMMAVQEQIVTACQTFKSILASMAYFEGEEVIEIT
jgi:hypothetical protein